MRSLEFSVLGSESMSGRRGVDKATYLGAIRTLGFLSFIIAIIEAYNTKSLVVLVLGSGMLAIIFLAGKLKEEALKTGEIHAITNE